MLSILSLTNQIDVKNEDHISMHGPPMHNHSLLDNEDDDDVHDDVHDHDNSAMSKAEIRKSNKPIMEKRRRARINTCLNELKSLILDALKKDPSRHSKLEKADILEMTVKHLQAVQRQHLALAVAHDPSVLGKFKGGFGECAQEIIRYISRIDGVDAGVRQRLMQHLSNCTNSLNATTPISFTSMAGLPMPLNNVASLHPPTPQQGELNNSQARLLHRFVAARLAAAGDTAGAALVLNGGISLLGRGFPPPNQGPPHAPCPQPPPTQVPIHPPYPLLRQNMASRPVKIENTGPSSSGDVPSVRISAFTAVKRISNPTEGNCEGPQQAKVLVPTALRPVLCSEGRPKTMVQAQVALKPVPLHSGEDMHSPLDFSFRRHSIIGKRPLEEPSPITRPLKVAKKESSPFLPTPAHPSNSILQESPPSTSQNICPIATQSRTPSANRPDTDESHNNSTEGEDKDMWRPWQRY